MGFFWGLPIPYFIFLVHCNASFQDLNFDTMTSMLAAYPHYSLFLLHPIMFAVAFGAFGILKQASDENYKEHLKLYRNLAHTDQLTQLATRSYFHQMAYKEIVRCERQNSTLCLVFIDIDHFKKVNDLYGHPIGDKTLARISQLLKSACRPYDIIARWGGEEFVALLPNISIQEAFHFAERLRKEIEKNTFQAPSNTFHCTISAGLAEFNKLEELDTLIHRADQALYQAKTKGRNQSVIFSSSSSEPELPLQQYIKPSR
jgi:diguanylate cyclase (GGDEF)-like protein